MSHTTTVSHQNGLFTIERHGKTLLTPKGEAYVLPTECLAQAIAEEWNKEADKKKIDVSKMPMTQFAATSLDIIASERAKTIKDLVAYVGSELLCHRADYPEDLVSRQQEVWQPLLDWCEKRFGAALYVGKGLMPLSQSNEAHRLLKQAIENYDNFRLTGLRCAADVTGSLILGLALAEKYLNIEETFQAAELDGSYQISGWGEDPALAVRRAEIKRDIENLERWFALLA